MADGDELADDLVSNIQGILSLPKDPKDPLDILSNDFNPADVLNTFFPNEASLDQIASVQESLAQSEAELQKEIGELQDEMSKNKDPNRMQLIQEMISDLLSQMSLIREKATESEAVVRDITKDIQVLDHAKKNLILSMTTLKRLQMLVNALTQLEDLVKDKKYAEIAETLSAVKQISSSFKPYTSVPRIAQLWKRVHEVQGELRTVIEADFDAFYLQQPPHPSPTQIASACLAVDVLSPDVRVNLVGRYVALELKDYRRIFRVGNDNAEASGLDNIERRFAWFKRVLGRHELEQGRVFPVEWRVSWALAGGFCVITRDDVATLLSKAGNDLTVQLLLDTLQMVTEFESGLAKKWATPFPEIISHTSPPSHPDPKPISSAFEPHMGIFVEAQNKALSDTLTPHFPSSRIPRPSLDLPMDVPVEPEAESTVLPSSTELFYFYGQSLEQCAMKMGTGRVMWDLAAVWRKWLKVYAEDVLLARMKRPGLQPQSRRSTDTRYDPHELKQICLIINTADYCQTTASELEEKIREKISDTYKDKVTFQAERELFVSVVSSAITLLITHLDTATDPFFTAMSRTSYLTHTQVSGPSMWLGELARAVEGVVGVVKSGHVDGGQAGTGGGVEGKKYVRNFLDKCSSFILAKFTSALVKSRPLKEIGAEQLLIDLQAIKECLLRLPGETLASSSYTRSFTKSTTRLEALLKVIVTPVDPPEAFILNYAILIGDASFSNFQKILDLKGTPKASQGDLLDSFLTITSTRSELESTSFLSSLDMDPSSTHAATSLASPGGSRVHLPPVGGEGDGSPTVGRAGDGKREVFSDFKRFVSFGLARRDSQAPSQ